MSRYAIAGTIPGLIAGHVGRPLRLVSGLSTGLRGLELHASLTDESSAVIDLRVGDGTTWATLSITAGQRAASVALGSVLWPAGADLDLEVTADTGADAYSLAVNLFAEESSVASSPTGGLVTLAQLEDALGITGTTSAEEQAYLQRQIDVGSAIIREYTGQHISLATYREQWACPRIVYATGLPLVSITSATHTGGSLTPATELAFEPDSGRIWRVSGAARIDFTGQTELDVVYVAGWDPIPAPIAECLYVGIAQRWAGWASSRGLSPIESVSRMQFPDGGALSYATQDAGQLRHFLAGFPLWLLRDYRNPISSPHGDAAHIWEHFTP